MKRTIDLDRGPGWAGVWRCVITVILAAICAAVPAWGQQETKPAIEKMSLEELMNVEVDTVYGASKFNQKVTDAPSYVTIISAEEIARHGYRTLGEVLQAVPGFYVNYDRNYTYVGVRGFQRPGDYNNRVLVLIDGHRVNETVYESFDAGSGFPLDMDLVDRVEVIRGPGSALYGTDAFFAVVNIITKRARDVNGFEAAASAGSQQTFGTRATYRRQTKRGAELLFSGTFYHSLGNHRLFFPEFDTRATNNGYAMEADADGARNFFASAEWKDFSVQGLYGWRQKTIPTASFWTVFNDPRTNTIDARGYVDFKYDHTFANQWELLARVGYDQYDYHGVYVMDYAGEGVPPYSLNEDYCWGKWMTFAAEASRTFYGKHHITVGTEERWNPVQNQKNFDLAPYSLTLDDHRSSTDASLYAQDDFAIRHNVTLAAGFRYDHHSQFGGSTNPRVGLIYSPKEKTTLKVLYGQAFRAPNVYELYYVDRISEEANPALQPEKVRTAEVVLEQYFEKHIHATVAGFYNSLSGLITEQIDSSTGMAQFVNLQNVTSKGLDFELAGKWPSGWEGRVAYTVQDVRDKATHEGLSDSPKHLPKLQMIAPVLPKKLFLGVDGVYESKRQCLNGSWAGGYFTANATLSTGELWKGLNVSLTAYNLFDRRYVDPGGPEHLQPALQQDVRAVRVKLTWRFGER